MHQPQPARQETCTILLNGTPMALSAQISIAVLLQQQDMAERRLAVEVNGTVVPRSQHDTVQLKDGDRVEIIQAIGGG
jgi:sulfur carrier protein